jgi:hypothetical protein
MKRFKIEDLRFQIGAGEWRIRTGAKRPIEHRRLRVNEESWSIGRFAPVLIRRKSEI